MAAPPPVTTLQRGAAIPSGARSFAMAAGAGIGGIKWGQPAGGVAVQQRLSQGAGSELQLAGQAVAYKCSGCIEEQREVHVSVGGRVGWREQISPRVAFLAGVGGAGGAGGTAVGGDVGLVGDVFSVFYLSGRVGAAEPITRSDVYNKRDDDHDGTDEVVMDERTLYGMAAVGMRLGRDTGLVAEAGFGLLSAGQRNGAAVYGLIGVDVLKLAGN